MNALFKSSLVLAAATGIVLQLAAADAPPCAIRLTDVTKQTGIDFVHTDGSSGERYIVETVCAGMATFDYNGDGLIDIFFLNGAPLRGTRCDVPPTPRLYRNEGNWKFTDVTRESGLAVTCYGLGVAVGDYDNDGHPDVYLNNFGTNLLFRNKGDGTFADVTRQAGVSDTNHVGAGACFLDMDGDGDLDLFVSHYIDFTYERHHVARFNGYPAYVGPLDYPTTPNRLYRNNGDGTFTDVSEESGIGAHKGAGMGIVCGDLDGDGDTDIVVGNDETGDFLFLNDGKGRFEEVGLFSGIAYNFNGKAHGTMGIDCGDYDNDGWLDLFATSYQQETATLFRNLGKGLFEDVTARTGAGEGTLPFVTWGCAIVDLDNDGDRDLFIAAGHLHDNVELFDTTTTYHARNIVQMNLGNGRFVNVSDRCGDGLAVKLSSRGAAFDDLDNDGDIDIVILNSRREPTILRNDSAPGNHWLQVQLRGVKTNRDGVGARVTVVSGDLKLVDEVHSGRSYQSHFGSRLHFGLGPRDRIDRIEVQWVGGGRQIIQNAGVDRLITIIEETTASKGP
ncbi:MAG TPA: CRTAC1 family protein [Verrucomicrobiota bacterium]|nr:CRTAC1 family protein [Verrucomicrobiota bacterium]HOK77408.1 CRTAC1 family protein [Verrucomicrobiota bacterium]